LKKYEKSTGERPIKGTTADESRLRLQSYLRREGCNVFTEGKEDSQPMYFWTEKDVWEYRERFNIPFSRIYENPCVKRTGCAICGFGACQNYDRFFHLFYNHPKLYNLFMSYANNGVSYREALHYIGIELPDDLL